MKEVRFISPQPWKKPTLLVKTKISLLAVRSRRGGATVTYTSQRQIAFCFARQRGGVNFKARDGLCCGITTNTLRGENQLLAPFQRETWSYRKEFLWLSAAAGAGRRAEGKTLPCGERKTCWLTREHLTGNVAATWTSFDSWSLFQLWTKPDRFELHLLNLSDRSASCDQWILQSKVFY